MNVYEARHAGREYCCNTEGSEHYKEGGVEPIDLMIAKGLIEDFCIGNMVKYATRFKITRNLVDLKKVSDYAHILCGIELNKYVAVNPAAPITTEDKPVEPWGEGKEVSEWISVNERLPEPDVPVLVTYIGFTDNKPYSDAVAKWSLELNGYNGGWVWMLDEGEVEVKITHWMPLPEPPKEE